MSLDQLRRFGIGVLLGEGDFGVKVLLELEVFWIEIMRMQNTTRNLFFFSINSSHGGFAEYT